MNNEEGNTETLMTQKHQRELLMEIAPAPAAAIPIPTTAAAVGMGDFHGEEPLGCGADTRSGNWINRTKNANNLFWT